MLNKPFYDPLLTYDENYLKGPFGAFEDGKIYKDNGSAKFNFLGHKINFPFGIAAGPLINSNFVKAAFEKGFDICVYKTVRSDVYPCHAFPNILSVHFKGRDLTSGKLKQKLLGDESFTEPISITNSFGVPSKRYEVWQKDARKAMGYAGKGQMMILSFMGTVRKNQTQKEFIDDFVLAAKLAKETGAKILEANLSCPNVGNEGLVCYDLKVTEEVTRKMRKVIGNIPLVLKVGYYEKDADLEKLARIANEYANNVAGINTLQATIVDERGEQALPGPNRLKSGVCGSGIKWAGIDLVKRLSKIREKNNYKFSITGIGGVTTTKDYSDYRAAGADVVMSATGVMWNPYFAQQLKKAKKF